jgi:uncharacterized repeat protein (TIGR01451 family)
VIDDFLTDNGTRVATATIRDSGGNVVPGGAATIPAAGADFTYSESFTGALTAGPYVNHVDVFTAPRGANDQPVASSTAGVGFTSQSATVGSTATISDSNPCAAGFSCGTPQSLTSSGNFTAGGSGTTLGTATGTTTISYTRRITNNSICGSSGSQTTTITNTVTVTPGDNSAQPPQTAQATVTNTADPCITPPTDVSIVKAGPATIRPGFHIVYTLTITNNGPSTAAGVTVTDMLPAGLLNPGVTTTKGTCSLGPPITCDLGSLTSGEIETVRIVAVVGPHAGPTIENTATVSSMTPDPIPANNTSTAVTVVVPSSHVRRVAARRPL